MAGNDAARRRWLRRALVSLGLFLAGCVGLFFSLPALLIGSSETAPSDVIVHLAIDAHSKGDDYVADLRRQSVAKNIVCVSSQVSCGVYPADYAREHLISLGVPAEDVTTVHLPIAPCGAVKIPMIVDHVKSRGWRSVLWVGHPEDSRHAARVARKFFEREGIGFKLSYAPEDKEELTRDWWRTHWKVQRFVGEAMAISLDLLYSECR